LGGGHTEGARGSRRDAEFLAHAETRRARRSVAGPGCVLRESERSSPGSTFMLNVVSSVGILAHPAAEAAVRGRLHAVNADPPGANHHNTGALNPPRGLRSAREPEPTLCALRNSALSASPREPYAPRPRVSKSSPD